MATETPKNDAKADVAPAPDAFELFGGFGAIFATPDDGMDIGRMMRFTVAAKTNNGSKLTDDDIVAYMTQSDMALEKHMALMVEHAVNPNVILNELMNRGIALYKRLVKIYVDDLGDKPICEPILAFTRFSSGLGSVVIDERLVFAQVSSFKPVGLVFERRQMPVPNLIVEEVEVTDENRDELVERYNAQPCGTNPITSDQVPIGGYLTRIEYPKEITDEQWADLAKFLEKYKTQYANHDTLKAALGDTATRWKTAITSGDYSGLTDTDMMDYFLTRNYELELWFQKLLNSTLDIHMLVFAEFLRRGPVLYKSIYTIAMADFAEDAPAYKAFMASSLNVGDAAFCHPMCFKQFSWVGRMEGVKFVGRLPTPFVVNAKNTLTDEEREECAAELAGYDPVSIFELEMVFPREFTDAQWSQIGDLMKIYIRPKPGMEAGEPSGAEAGAGTETSTAGETSTAEAATDSA